MVQPLKKHPGKSAVKLPPIPEKIYFTIGEVSRLCKLKAHVLRYWEQEFAELSPAKRRGNRRYYQRDDILLVRRIRSLLYEHGYTIEGARGQLSLSLSDSANLNQQWIKETIADLETLLADR